MTIDSDTRPATAVSFTVTIEDWHHGGCYPFTVTMLRAAFALVAFCDEEDTPAQVAVRENALPGGWFIIDDRWSGVRFAPEELDHVVLLADMLLRSSDASHTEEDGAP